MNHTEISDQLLDFISSLIKIINEDPAKYSLYRWELDSINRSTQGRIAFYKTLINYDNLEDALRFNHNSDIFIGAMVIPRQRLPLYVNTENEFLKFLVQSRLKEGV